MLSTHWPALHDSPLAHTVPQLPQFCGSVWVLTHALLHICKFAPEHSHSPPTQLEPDGQTTPQAPQLLGSVSSVEVAMQTPLQSSKPAPQPQDPLLHELLAGHGELQAPQ